MKQDDNLHSPWKTIDQSIAFKTPWFKIRKQHMLTPNDKRVDYYIHDTNDSVICVCVSDDNKLLIERQYRPPVEKVSIDYPAGRMEKDDATTEAAISRELQEETGFTATTMKKLGVLDKEPAFSTTRMHVFLAQGSIDGDATPEETEHIHAEFVSPDEVLRLIDSGDMCCTFCVSATFLAFKELGWLGFNSPIQRPHLADAQ